MFWADRIIKAAGVTLLFLAALVIVGDVLDTVAVGDSNLLARGEIENLLQDINDNEVPFVLSVGFDVASNMALLAAAAILYLAFRERSRVLALFGAFGLLASGIAFAAADAGALTEAFLAKDFVEKGGPGGIGAGDPVILQSARVVVVFSMMSTLVGLTALGFGLLALGALLGWGPVGEMKPPRWLGGLAIIAGLGMILSWLYAVDWDAGGVVSFIGEIGGLLWLIILGGWLLVQPEGGARPAAGLAYERSP